MVCDMNGLEIGVLFSQEGRLITFFSEKLNYSHKKYSLYDHQSFVIV